MFNVGWCDGGGSDSFFGILIVVGDEKYKWTTWTSR